MGAASHLYVNRSRAKQKHTCTSTAGSRFLCCTGAKPRDTLEYNLHVDLHQQHPAELKFY